MFWQLRSMQSPEAHLPAFSQVAGIPTSSPEHAVPSGRFSTLHTTSKVPRVSVVCSTQIASSHCLTSTVLEVEGTQGPPGGR